ncbi:MAG: hypothetical protein QOE61_5313 [Micromonosporaceae bacterium]|jgi:2-polyprenyl-3-methyl-5-hydroxy-6-metoxy-1,4-benzoquinol methylase|nr:hypothetical protein [Micromonosporaceae bacterium]
MEDSRSPPARYRASVYDRVRESYDRVAERYAEEIGGELAGKPVDRALLRSLTELASTVEETTGPGSMADLGCGPGHIADYLAAQGVNTVAIDVIAAGFVVMARTDREPWPGVELESRRCYLLCQRS